MAKPLPKELSAELERQAWEHRMRGWTFDRIARELSTTAVPVAESTVYRMVQRANKKLAKEFLARAEEIKAEHTARLEHLAAEALRVWEESKAEVSVRRESVRREIVYGDDKKPKTLRDARGEPVHTPDGQPVSEMVTVEHTESTEYRQQLPDARYLAEARADLADIRKIWGLDAERGEGVGVFIQKAYINVNVEDV